MYFILATSFPPHNQFYMRISLPVLSICRYFYVKEANPEYKIWFVPPKSEKMQLIFVCFYFSLWATN